MDPLQLRFGLSVVLSFFTWGLAAKYYFWPALRSQPGRAGFRPILLLHSTRFVGSSDFLVPGVVASPLPSAFAVPAAYGDLIAALLALAALAVLETRIGLFSLWVFNLWGTSRSAICVSTRVTHRSGSGSPVVWRAMYFVPTVAVPLLLVTHVLAFRMLSCSMAHGARQGAGCFRPHRAIRVTSIVQWSRSQVLPPSLLRSARQRKWSGLTAK